MAGGGVCTGIFMPTLLYPRLWHESPHWPPGTTLPAGVNPGRHMGGTSIHRHTQIHTKTHTHTHTHTHTQHISLWNGTVLCRHTHTPEECSYPFCRHASQ